MDILIKKRIERLLFESEKYLATEKSEVDLRPKPTGQLINTLHENYTI